ncbi:MAG: alpha/beta fold hydrolase, partial [Nocardioidaceae bacterium]
MTKVISADGTAIAYDRTGQGPAVVLVDGALCSRAQGPMPELAPLLAPYFTVYTYDRRGRNESGDTAPYAVDREVEDLAAVIAEAGGSASVYGTSSGAALALTATAKGLPIDRLVAFEAPFVVDDTRKPYPSDWGAQLAAATPGDAVKYFMSKCIGLPGFVVALMRLMPAWKGMTAVAHTLPYDAALLGDNCWGKPLDPRAVVLDRRTHPDRRRWQEPAVDAQLRAGRRGRRTGCRASRGAGPEPHDQGDRDRPGAARVLRRCTMRFRTTILQSGKTATGIEVPEEIVTALGDGRKPAVLVTIGGHT